MGTYKFGKYSTWDGYKYFAISKKTFLGWKEEKIWKLGYGFIDSFTESKKEQQMMEAVDRLVRAGHTVL